MSRARAIKRRVWHDPDTGYEYEPDPRPPYNRWHEIDAHANMYRDIDSQTGEPVNGSEGNWRTLK